MADSDSAGAYLGSDFEEQQRPWVLVDRADRTIDLHEGDHDGPFVAKFRSIDDALWLCRARAHRLGVDSWQVAPSHPSGLTRTPWKTVGTEIMGADDRQVGAARDAETASLLARLRQG